MCGALFDGAGSPAQERFAISEQGPDGAAKNLERVESGSVPLRLAGRGTSRRFHEQFSAPQPSGGQTTTELGGSFL